MSIGRYHFRSWITHSLPPGDGDGPPQKKRRELHSPRRLKQETVTRYCDSLRATVAAAGREGNRKP